MDLQEGPETIAARRLTAELTALDGEREVAYRNGRRLVPRLVPAAVARPMNAAPFRKGTLYLVTGGLGALGMEICGPLLRDAGVPIDPVTGVPEHDEDTLETVLPGLFIAGVVVAGFDANKVFIENGRFHGDKIVARLLGRPTPPPPLLSAELDT